MSITINGIVKEDTAYDKEITFTYEGESYSVLLHWDNCDGYYLTFLDTVSPDWADNWNGNNDTVLAFVLDELTDEKLEEVA